MVNRILATISRIPQGDRAAVAWLYSTFAPGLLRRLDRRFHAIPGVEPEDLLQDTFLYALDHDARVLARFCRKHANDKPGEHDVHHFLWCAACGIASNRRRSIQRRPSRSIDVSSEIRYQGPEAAALARDTLERISAQLWNRSQRLGLYFQLRYRDGLKPVEIASAAGWSLTTTYKLKQALDKALDRWLETIEVTVHRNVA